MFHLDEVLALYEKHDRYGVALLGGDELTLYIIEGTKQEKISGGFGVHRLKDHSKGGQSAPRFQRIHDSQEKEIAKKAKAAILTAFTPSGKPHVKGIIVGSTSPELCQQVVKDLPLVVRVLKLQHLSLIPIVRSLDVIISTVSSTADRALLNALFEQMSATLDASIFVYGEKDIKTALAAGSLKRLIVTTALKDKFPDFKGTLQVITSYDARFHEDYQGMIGVLWHAGLQPVEEVPMLPLPDEDAVDFI